MDSERRKDYPDLLAKLEENTLTTKQILKILNGNGEVGICAKVDVMWNSLTPKLDTILDKMLENKERITKVESRFIDMASRLAGMEEKKDRKAYFKLDKTITLMTGIALTLMGVLIRIMWG